MKNLLLFLLLTGSVFAAEVAPGISDADFKSMDAQVERAMQAYNAGNWKAFYADYAKMMAGIATEQAFKTLYTDNYKKKYGNYKSRKFNPAASSAASGMNAVVEYAAVFDKGPAKLQINFMKEGSSWKLQQVQVNK